MIDLDEILSPISSDAPAGENLRYSDVFHALSEARREDEQAGILGLWTKRADWDLVVALSAHALSTRSKDLQLACWLAEALYRCKGLAGLAEGLGLVTALCEQFWDCLYPAVTHDDLEARVAPLLAMEVQLVRALAQLPLTDPDPDSGVCYALQHWLAAEKLEALGASDPCAYTKALVSGAVSLEQIRDTAAGTPVIFYQTLLNRLQLCAVAVSELESLLGVMAGADAPSFSSLSAMLANIERMIGIFAGLRMPQPVAAGDISSRREAYQMLELASNYLLSAEPHSLVPYLVKGAIQWGNRPLA